MPSEEPDNQPEQASLESGGVIKWFTSKGGEAAGLKGLPAVLPAVDSEPPLKNLVHARSRSNSTNSLDPATVHDSQITPDVAPAAKITPDVAQVPVQVADPMARPSATGWDVPAAAAAPSWGGPTVANLWEAPASEERSAGLTLSKAYKARQQAESSSDSESARSRASTTWSGMAYEIERSPKLAPRAAATDKGYNQLVTEARAARKEVPPQVGRLDLNKVSARDPNTKDGKCRMCTAGCVLM